MTFPKLEVPLALVAAAAIVVLAAATAIGGETKKFDSKVTLARRDQFHGQVRSRKHACEAHRLVKIFNVQASPNGLLGKTRADGSGDWSFPASDSGDFYAKVRRHKEQLPHGKIVCRSDLSPVLRFGE